MNFKLSNTDFAHIKKTVLGPCKVIDKLSDSEQRKLAALAYADFIKSISKKDLEQRIREILSGSKYTKGTHSQTEKNKGKFVQSIERAVVAEPKASWGQSGAMNESLPYTAKLKTRRTAK